MSKKQKQNPKRSGVSAAPPRKRKALWMGTVGALIGGAGIVLLAQQNHWALPWAKGTSAADNQTNSAPAAAAPAEIPTMAINTAVMVTVELDFGPKIPSVAEALREVDRRYTPTDGRGRTFAILDAYGEPTPDGKLHVSMHVSSEKPGLGALVFRRTGEVLWQSRIVATNSAAQTFTGKNLLLLIDNGEGKTFTVDGSANPVSILDASIKEMGIPVRVFWPDGAVREVTCIYSACGCPVKAMVKREGERTVRTKELPVMFPDDPAVLTIISRLMQWQ
jgi:hypothetical protein